MEWDVPGLSGLSLDARAIHTSSQYADGANTLELKSWTRYDIGARYIAEVASKMVTLRARIDNVTDRAHAGSVIVNEGNNRFFEPGARRSVYLGVELVRRFP